MVDYAMNVFVGNFLLIDDFAVGQRYDTLEIWRKISGVGLLGENLL